MSYPTRHPHNDLSHDVDRLSRIVKATKELNSTLDLSELARIILRIVRDEVGIERGTVFVMSPDGLGLARMDHQSENRSVFGYEKRFAARLGAESERAVDIGGF